LATATSIIVNGNDVNLSDVNTIYCHIAQGAKASKLKELLLDFYANSMAPNFAAVNEPEISPK
jgi:hypothetical protein